jgi:hypothetical protein
MRLLRSARNDDSRTFSTGPLWWVPLLVTTTYSVAGQLILNCDTASETWGCHLHSLSASHVNPIWKDSLHCVTGSPPGLPVSAPGETPPRRPAYAVYSICESPFTYRIAQRWPGRYIGRWSLLALPLCLWGLAA